MIRLNQRTIVRTGVKALLYALLGPWAYIVGGFGLKDYFMIPIITNAIRAKFPQLPGRVI